MSREVALTVWVSGDAYQRMREFADEHQASIDDVAGRLLERAARPRVEAPKPAGTDAVEFDVEARRDLMIRQGLRPRFIAAVTGIRVQQIYTRRQYLKRKDAA